MEIGSVFCENILRACGFIEVVLNEEAISRNERTCVKSRDERTLKVNQNLGFWK